MNTKKESNKNVKTFVMITYRMIYHIGTVYRYLLLMIFVFPQFPWPLDFLTHTLFWSEHTPWDEGFRGGDSKFTAQDERDLIRERGERSWNLWRPCCRSQNTHYLEDWRCTVDLENVPERKNKPNCVYFFVLYIYLLYIFLLSSH